MLMMDYYVREMTVEKSCKVNMDRFSICSSCLSLKSVKKLLLFFILFNSFIASKYHDIIFQVIYARALVVFYSFQGFLGF